MSTVKKATPITTHKDPRDPIEQSVLFTKENYKWMLIGLIIMAIGFF